MTSREAAHTLLHSLYKLPSGRFIIVPEQNESFLDAICLAICALMREEEAGKGKHEAKIDMPDEPPPWEEDDGVDWHDAKTEPPKKDGYYYAKQSLDSEKIWYCYFRSGRWVTDSMGFSLGINIGCWTEPENLRNVIDEHDS